MFNTNEYFKLEEEIKSNNNRNELNGNDPDKKMIGKKRQSSRLKKNLLDLHNAGNDSSNLSTEGKTKGKSNQKRKTKRNSLEYFVPQRPIFRASEALVSVINKVISKVDHLQVLRGYRNIIKEDPDFNNFKCKKVEKLFCSDNSNLKLNIDFKKDQISLEFKKSFYLPDNNLISTATEHDNNILFHSFLADEKKVSKNEIPIDNPILNNNPKDVLFNYIENDEYLSNKKNQSNLEEQIVNKNEGNSSLLNIRHSELKIISSEYNQEIEEKFKNKVISSIYVDNIDILRYKAENNYYTRMKDFVEDVYIMFKAISSNISKLIVPNNQQTIDIAMDYLKSIFIETMKLISPIEKTFNELYEKDIKSVIDNNKLPKINCSFKNIPVKKGYQVIEDYYHIFPEITKEKVKTSLLPSCKGGCCNTFEDLGPLNLEKSRWDSKCLDRHNNLECNSDFCGCVNENCKNQSIRNKIYKKIGEDVIEKYAWGIDLFTYRNLIEFLPLNFTDEFKAENFIEKTLIKSLSNLEVNGHSIKKACKYMIERCAMTGVVSDNAAEDGEVDFSDSKLKYSDYFFAKHLLNVYEHSKLAVQHSSTAYSKGVGIFCKKEGGIKQNELITVYLGEIYPPWYWYEKQDLIKKNKLDSELPDFYNIMLERLKSDLNGYDIVMVDPNSKGNFASRMSHSCQPNCNTVLMCTNNEYVIGMFATKDIQFGDELTFDYNSVTEKEKEFQDAICLCSSFNCRGHYLIYSNSILFTEVLSKFHTFLHRNTILLQACNPEFENNKNQLLTKIDEILLKKYSIGSSILRKAPFWIKKWAALILRYVDWESKILPQMLNNKSLNIKSEEQKNIENRNNQFIEFISKKDKTSNTLEIANLHKNNSFNFSSENEINKKDSSFYNSNLSNLPSNLISDSNLNKLAIKNNNFNSKKQNSSFTSNKKYDFDGDNFYYPGKKTYQSSTRQKKSETTDNDTEITIENNEKFSLTKKKKKEKFNHFNDNIHNKINKILSEKKKANTESHINIEIECTDVYNDKIINKGSNDYIDMVIETNIKKENENKEDKLNEEIQNSNDTGEKIELQLPTLENKTDEELNSQVHGITENRIQNIAISIDKVIHVLDLMNIYEPPLEILSEKEIIQFYWGKEDSLRSSLEMNISSLLNYSEFRNISNELTQLLSNIHNILMYNKEDLEDLQKIREKFFYISKKIKICGNLDKSNKYIFYSGLSDVLYLYASTKIYFKNNKKYDKKNAESEEIFIRQRDINTNTCVEDLDGTVCSGKKTYDKLYIWGQLSGWYKQTVDKPNASLSAERRGSLSYPDIDSFFTDCSYEKFHTRKKENPKSSIFQYPGSSRKNFYAKLIENPSMMWPVGNEWSYKNKNKIYGTVQFDSIYTSKNFFNLEEANFYFLNILHKMETEE